MRIKLQKEIPLLIELYEVSNNLEIALKYLSGFFKSGLFTGISCGGLLTISGIVNHSISKLRFIYFSIRLAISK